jgi:hypothetical protein
MNKILEFEASHREIEIEGFYRPLGMWLHGHVLMFQLAVKPGPKRTFNMVIKTCGQEIGEEDEYVGSLAGLNVFLIPKKEIGAG